MNSMNTSHLHHDSQFGFYDWRADNRRSYWACFTVCGSRRPTIGSIALTLVLLETPSLRSHALYLFIKCVHFIIVRAFFDFAGSLPRSFSSAFSTESLEVSAMVTSSSLF
jgi:hypothetical protein